MPSIRFSLLLVLARRGVSNFDGVHPWAVGEPWGHPGSQAVTLAMGTYCLPWRAMPMLSSVCATVRRCLEALP